MRQMTVDEIVEYLNNDKTFDDFAFRGDDFIPSDNFKNSWYHGDDMEAYELDGVFAIIIPARSRDYIIGAINKAKYYGDNVFLLRGTQINADEVTYAPSECLIQDNQIVCIVSLPSVPPCRPRR